MNTSSTRCGFIALIGAPNAGKSTLMNNMVGAKVSIVTPKAQTTRSRITGVAIEGQSQLVFVDVPGVFKAKQRFEKAMVDCAWSGSDDADVTLFMFDASKKPGYEAEEAVERLSKSKRPLYLVLNKVDLVGNKQALLPLIMWFQERANFAEVFMISALESDGVRELKAKLAELVPEGLWMYPEDHLTDLPKRLMAAEITREKCFMALQQELPYALMVETEGYEERKDGSVKINQVIIVQNERQKMIVLGAKGTMLKTIGERARKEIEREWGIRCHLFLFVKVREDWKEKPEHYATLGLSFS